VSLRVSGPLVNIELDSKINIFKLLQRIISNKLADDTLPRKHLLSVMSVFHWNYASTWETIFFLVTHLPSLEFIAIALIIVEILCAYLRMVFNSMFMLDVTSEAGKTLTHFSCRWTSLCECSGF